MMRAAALALLSGLLWCYAAPPHLDWYLAWVAMVPLLLALESARSRRQALGLGMLSGFICSLTAQYWLVAVLQRFAVLSWPAAIALVVLYSLYQSVVVGLFSVLVYHLSRRGIAVVWIAPLAMVSAEWLIPLLFPYDRAITQAWHPALIQMAELGGPMVVSAQLLLANGLVFELLMRRGSFVRRSLVAAGLLTATVLYGVLRMQAVDRQAAAAPQLRIGVVQPNVAYDLKGLLHPGDAGRQLRALQSESHELEAEGAELILWSESAYPFALPADLRADFAIDDQRNIRGPLHTPVVVGAVTREAGQRYPYNSALLFDADGNVQGRYDKERLLTFSEQIPGIEHFPALRRMFPVQAGRFTPGTQTLTLPLSTPSGQWRLGPLICYEDILPMFVRKLAALHPHLLVNLTNDSWFGEDVEPWQHLALAVFATVEERTALVRAVNSGVSAYIDPTGRVIEETYSVDPHLHPRGADHAIATLPLLEGGHTVYAAVGNLFAWLCAAATLLMWLYPRRAILPADVDVTAQSKLEPS